MSHWTKAKVTIKDLDKLVAAAESLGVQVDRSKKVHQGRHTGRTAVEMVIGSGERSGGTAAAVIDNHDGTYSVQIDNYQNPLTQKLGRDCSKLCQEYTKLIVEDQIAMMGGIISDTETKNGEIHLTVSL